ncbi:MAG: hypothetical protein BAJALOKI1v1_1870005 [Promethearchaeota archaeon]|nr:MAG: hypothetical protein BAJALOKI1v1_1870005 [Candidatus Lokiarchaeota archaeon]
MNNIPYQRKSGQFERARGIGHVPIIENKFVKNELKSYHISHQEKVDEIPQELIFDLSQEINKETLPKYIFSFDGSSKEVEVDERFPSTRLGYLQIAAVLVLMEEIIEQEKHTFINPSKLKDTIYESIQPMVFPGSNIRKKNCTNLVESWRYGIYEIFTKYVIEDTALLDIYFTLLKYGKERFSGNNIILKKCAATERCAKNIPVPKEGCKCPSCGLELFPTDALRVYEEVYDLQSNSGPLNRMMSCLEHLYMIGYLEYLRKRRLDLLSNTAFIIDGPLAIFGPQAWIHRSILNFINTHIYQNLEDQSFKYPIIVGIEKTGNFAEHADIISKFLKPQTLMLLTENYIYKYILSCQKPQSGEYGSETYYGQKLFYKTKKQQILTITIPTKKKPLFTKEILKHPALLGTLNLLDHIGTIIYKDALIPIALAHSYASIPLKTGSKILKILSQKELNIT